MLWTYILDYIVIQEYPIRIFHLQIYKAFSIMLSYERLWNPTQGKKLIKNIFCMLKLTESLLGV